MLEASENYIPVNKAFSKQSVNYDIDDAANKVLQDLRQQVYDHVDQFIKPQSKILELNAGTGIDALRFVQAGHSVHATDLSDGMIEQIHKKIEKYSLQSRFTAQQVSYDKLNTINDKKFDAVFSNFGGLNCIKDLSQVTRNLPALLNPDASVTFVIMPVVCPWELLWLFKGNVKAALRRFHTDGVMAHLEGEYFRTYYHSLASIKNAFRTDFEFMVSEGLASLSPPPSKENFPVKLPKVYSSLRKIDSFARHTFPFNRWGDHIIVTFRLRNSNSDFSR